MPLKTIKIFVASPGDVNEEREVLSDTVVSELRRIFGNPQMFDTARAIELEAVRWETHAWPAVGEDAQAVINNEIGEYDILVGIMWRRFGTPTNRAGSGTGEEFERAYEYFKAYKRPYIMFYFRTSPFYTTNAKEIAQFQKVMRFRKKLESLGVFFWEYANVLDFERRVREHLIRQIAQFIPAPSVKLIPGPTSDSKALVFSREHQVKENRTVFFAYSMHDVEQVQRIYQLSRENGLNAWMDRYALIPGQEWKSAIRQAIRTSDAILIFISRNSFREASNLNLELRWILDENDVRAFDSRFVIPVRLDDSALPPDLASIRSIDLFADRGSEKLISVLRRITKSTT